MKKIFSSIAVLLIGFGVFALLFLEPPGAVEKEYQRVVQAIKEGREVPSDIRWLDNFDLNKATEEGERLRGIQQ